MRTLAFLLTAAVACCSAQTWSGDLIDPGCFATEQHNVPPTDTMTSVDQDVNAEIRYCTAKAKTKSFALILPDNTVLPFDAAGNAKAAGFVRTHRRKEPLRVTVTGARTGQLLAVQSIVMNAPARDAADTAPRATASPRP